MMNCFGMMLLFVAASITQCIGVSSAEAIPSCPCENAMPALRALYDATNGDNWTDSWRLNDASASSSNISSLSVCSLSGVRCGTSSLTSASITLSLSQRNLVGTIPSSFAQLYSNITSLSLANNSLNGVIPSTLSLLGGHLVSIDLSRNTNLSGTLSPEFSRWTSLTSFSVGWCALEGTLPAEYVDWGRTITYLNLNGNHFNGSISSSLLSAWSSLTHLYVTGNAFSGPLTFTASSSSVLEQVELTNNNFSGNFFDDSAAVLCDNWKRISNLRMTSNAFTGTIPFCLSQWAQTIVVFAVGSNHFSGTLPPSLSSLVVLQEFDVSYNNFSGTLPAAFSSMARMTWFSAQGNQFQGTLPPQYALWENLVRFIVNGNKMTGSLPEVYSSWTSAYDIRFAGNQFTGTLPESWGSAFHSVYMLLFTSNALTGTLPESYSGMTAIELLSFDENFLHGTLPSSWRSMSKLQVLGFQNNTQLSGVIPSTWAATMSSLLVLTICKTQLCGNASTFFTLSVMGFACPPSSLVTSFDVAAITAYVLAAPRTYSVACSAATLAPTPSTNTNTTNTTEAAASVLPYTAIATAAATAAVWSVVTTQALLPVSGASPPAASVAFLQGAFASSRLRRRCTAPQSPDTESDQPLSDPMDNPTQIELPDNAGAYAGGAVMGNSALLIAAVLLSHLATLLRAWNRRRRSSNNTPPSSSSSPSSSSPSVFDRLCTALWRDDKRSSCLPGDAMSMYSLLMTPSIAACVVLYLGDGGPWSYVIGAVGLGLWIVPFGLVVRQMHCLRFPFRTIIVRNDLNRHSPSRSCEDVDQGAQEDAEMTTTTSNEKRAAAAAAAAAIDVGRLMTGRDAHLVAFHHDRHCRGRSSHNQHHHHQSSAQQSDKASAVSHTNITTTLLCLQAFLWSPTHRWTIVEGATDTTTEPRRFYDAYGAFFAGVRSEWRMLFALELFVALVCGAVQGAAEEIGTSGDASDACSAAEWGSATLAALTGAVLLLHVVVRPCLVRYDELQTIVLTALTVASEIANAVGGDAGEQVGEMIALTAAILQAALAVLEGMVSLICLEMPALHVASPFYENKMFHKEGVLSFPSSGRTHTRRHENGTTNTPSRRRGHVTLEQIKGLKMLLKMIARDHQQREWGSGKLQHTPRNES